MIINKQISDHIDSLVQEERDRAKARESALLAHIREMQAILETTIGWMEPVLEGFGVDTKDHVVLKPAKAVLAATDKLLAECEKK